MRWSVALLDWNRLSSVFGAVLLGLCLIGIGRALGGASGSAAAFLGAVMFVCVLPGYLLMTVTTPDHNAPWPERWMLAAGFSLFLVQCACIIGLSLHIPLRSMGITILCLVTAAGAVRALSATQRTDNALIPSGTLLERASVLVWIACGVFAYLVGHNDGSWQHELLLVIGVADALRTALSPQEAFYISAVNPVYPFPGIHYAYALVAAIGGTTTVFSFEKMRLFWTLSALAAVFVGVRALSQSREYAYFALLGSSILLVTGQFGIIPPFYWGQLAPTSHHADVALNVIVAIGLASLLAWLSSNGRTRWDLVVLFACMAVLLSAIHQRELFFLLLYACCGLVLARARVQQLSLAVLVVWCLLAGVVAAKWTTLHAPGIAEVIGMSRTKLWDDFRQLHLATMFRPFTRLVIHYEASARWGLNGLMLALTAIILLFRPISLPLRVSGLALAIVMLIASFAVIAIPLLWATYDELLYIPLRLVIFVMYCCFWVAVGMLTTRVAFRKQAHRSPTQSILAGAALGLLLVGLATFLRRGIVPTEALALTAAACGVGGLFRSHHDAPGSPTRGEEPPLLLPGLALIATLAILAPAPGRSFFSVLTTRTISLTPEAAFSDLYARYLAADLGGQAGCRPDQVELLNQRIEFHACTPPLEVVERLRSLLPRDGILLVNPLGAFLGTGLVPVRVAAPVWLHTYRDWKAQFPRFRQVAQRTIDGFQGMPFFAPGESPEQRYLDARELGATHVLVDPMSREAVVLAVSARPDLFVGLMDQSGWVLVGLIQTAELPPGSKGPHGSSKMSRVARRAALVSVPKRELRAFSVDRTHRAPSGAARDRTRVNGPVRAPRTTVETPRASTP